jgi:uncharacterized membrane protein YeaQ/YmgE (transglycosylase-associated protein family)
MKKLVVGILLTLIYGLIYSVASIIVPKIFPFLNIFLGVIGNLLSNIFAGVLTEEVFNRGTLKSIRLKRTHLIVIITTLSLMTFLLFFGSLFKFLDFRPAGELFGFPKDAGFVTYIIDNSGSMGCKDKDEFQLSNGYCNEVGNYKVDQAKEWVRKDFKSLDVVKRLRIIEIGGLTAAEEKGKCNVNGLIDTKDINQKYLDTALNNIKANSSGATNINSAIVQAVREYKASGSKNQQIIVISDLGHNCGKPDVTEIVSELEKSGWDQKSIQSSMDKIIVFSLSPQSSSTNNSRTLKLNGQMAIISPIGVLNDSSLNTQEEKDVRALREQGIRVVELNSFRQLSNLSIPSSFDFWRSFLISSGTFFAIQVIISKNGIPSRKSSRRGSSAVQQNIEQGHSRAGNSDSSLTKEEVGGETEIILNWNCERVKFLSLVVIDRDENNRTISLDSIEINDESSEKFKNFRVGKSSEVGGPTNIFIRNRLTGSYLVTVEDVYRRESKAYPAITGSSGVVTVNGKGISRSFNCPANGNGKDKWIVCIVSFTEKSIDIIEINELVDYT